MSTITLTESAKEHINKVCEEWQCDAMSLDLKGGGCAGFEYVWGTKKQEDISKTDYIIETGKGKLAISEFSVPFLDGTEIDLQKEMFGTRLVIKNPNVQASCGCGESIGF